MSSQPFEWAANEVPWLEPLRDPQDGTFHANAESHLRQWRERAVVLPADVAGRADLRSAAQVSRSATWQSW